MSLTLDQLPAPLRDQVQAQIQRLEIENRLLREQLRLLRIEKFGKRSEKLSDDQLALLETEPSVSQAEVEKEAGQPASDKTAKPANPPRRKEAGRGPRGRERFPDWLERREEIIPCSCEQTLCVHCGQERPVIGYECSEELEMEPIKYYVRVIKREKRGSHCLPEEGVATAPLPPKIYPKSKLSNAFIVDTVVKKYFEHLPLYRQCLILEEQSGLELSRQTLDDAVMAAGQLLEPVSGTLRLDLIHGGYIQGDETTVPCHLPDVKGRNPRVALWQFSRPGGPAVFDFQRSRGRDGPEKFLEGFKGKLQTDGGAVFKKLDPAITPVGCMAHARRYFEKAHRLAPQDPAPLEILNQIKELYRVEAQAREAQMSVQERLALRQQHSVKLMEGLKKRIVQIRQAVLPASQLGKACDYALGQWSRLEEYLKDGRVEIDNNWCENAIRPVTLGRKNWLHIGSEGAGPKVAAIASVIETCRRLGINVRDYLTETLPKLPEWPINRVELNPIHWKAARNQ